jgi:hypothetical protein
MLSIRRQAAQEVANRLIAAENAIDIALQRTAELTGCMPMARGKANFAAEIGQDALERAAGTFAVLVQARREIVETHKELAETQARVGLKAYAMGGGMNKFEAQAESGDIVKIAA